MLTIQDLSKQLDMTAVRGGHRRGWSSCGDEDSRERFDSDDRDHGDRDDRHRWGCERNDEASTRSFASVGLNLSSYGMYGASK